MESFSLDVIYLSILTLQTKLFRIRTKLLRTKRKLSSMNIERAFEDLMRKKILTAILSCLFTLYVKILMSSYTFFQNIALKFYLICLELFLSVKIWIKHI